MFVECIFGDRVKLIVFDKSGADVLFRNRFNSSWNKIRNEKDKCIGICF